MKFCDVILPVHFLGMDQRYTYCFDGEAFPGMRVRVPWGKKQQKTGIISRIYNTPPKGNLELKGITSLFENRPFLSKETMELAAFMEDRYFTGPYASLQPFMFPGPWDVPFFDEQGVLLDEKEPVGYSLVKERISFAKGSPQEKVVEILSGKESLTKSEIRSLAHVSESPINTLIKKGVLVEGKRVCRQDNKDKIKGEAPLSLTEEQERAFQGILKSTYPVNLLHGLTGSGKTEVYFHLIRHVINRGGNVLFLVPEIALTPQMIEKLNRRFPGEISVLHSRLTGRERRREWLKIYNGEVHIAVGVRSGVFAPFSTLDLIIIDEEQEDSYGYHGHLRYDTREVAILRGKLLGAKVLLGSATPSISTFKSALDGKIGLFTMTKRPASHGLPEMVPVDMREELNSGNFSLISGRLYEEMNLALDRKEQIILFLNRRGYSNFVSCRNCGHVITCDFCDISMNYHKTIHRLRCHYCGSTKPMPAKCPKCGSPFIKTFGVGTQQVEEEVKRLFPQARIHRMDRDTTYKKDSYEAVYKQMQNYETDILIGTQMLAKGLDFPNVTLVGILAADLSLYVSDYRAQEKTFQLVSQVAGRAGRGSRPGQVVLQSYNPNNYSLTYAAGEQYRGFYEEEIRERQVLFYPPFCAMPDIRVTSTDKEEARSVCNLFYLSLKEAYSKDNLLGTQVLEFPKIKNKYTYHFQCKVNLEDENLLRKTLLRVYDMYRQNNKVTIDIEFL